MKLEGAPVLGRLKRKARPERVFKMMFFERALHMSWNKRRQLPTTKRFAL